MLRLQLYETLEKIKLQEQRAEHILPLAGMGNGIDYKERTFGDDGNVLNFNCAGGYTAVYFCSNSSNYRTERENFIIHKLS